VTPCFNNTPCPIDCVGSWGVSGSCSGACEGGNGTLPETYTVSTPAQWSGQACPFANGAARSVLPCTNNDPCPVPCNYTWLQNGNCTGVPVARTLSGALVCNTISRLAYAIRSCIQFL
jgi:hypothetical protein